MTVRPWQARLAEALGTFLLVLIGPGAIMVAAATGGFGHAEVALAFGLVVAIVVAATGHLGGAHINPAVTVALWSVGRFPGRDVMPYLVAQSAGAIVAAFALRWVLGPVGQLGATIPSISAGRAFAVEATYSGILGLVIASLGGDGRAPRPLAPLVIGATVYAGALVTGPLTGGSFNPARSLGPAVAGGGWNQHWIYWGAPVVGMVAAMWLYETVARPSRQETPPTAG